MSISYLFAKGNPDFYFRRACTAARRASTCSWVVAQLAQKRTPEWVSSTRSSFLGRYS